MRGRQRSIVYAVIGATIGLMVALMFTANAEAHTITRYDCRGVVAQVRAGDAVKRAAALGCARHRYAHAYAHKLNACRAYSLTAENRCIIRLVFGQ